MSDDKPKDLYTLAAANGELAHPGLPADQTPPNEQSRYNWRHRVAARLHGWEEQNFHYAEKQVRLTTAVYLAALKAAEEGLEPHPPAVPSEQIARCTGEPEQTHVHGKPIAAAEEPEEEAEEVK